VFNLTLISNPGIAFGLFPVGSSIGLTIMMMMQAGLCFGLAVYAFSVRSTLLVWPLLLLLSGAMANLIDRSINGAVTDYLDFYVGSYHWPAFNLADVWITVGIIGLLAIEFSLNGRNYAEVDIEK